MIVRTTTVSDWNAKGFNESLEKEIKQLQRENLVVEVHFSSVYMPERDNTEYNALLVGRRK